MEVHNRTRNRSLGTSVRTASGAIARMRGLLRTDNLPEGEGLWIRPCRGIHSIGMRYAFDALFIDPSMKVIAVCNRFPRNRVSKISLRRMACSSFPRERSKGRGRGSGTRSRSA